MGLIQPCELRWALNSTRNQLLPGENVLPAVVFPQTPKWIRTGMQAAMHFITAPLAMVIRRPNQPLLIL